MQDTTYMGYMNFTWILDLLYNSWSKTNDVHIRQWWHQNYVTSNHKMYRDIVHFESDDNNTEKAMKCARSVDENNDKSPHNDTCHNIIK